MLPDYLFMSQVVLQDYNEVTQGSNSKDRPQSSGPSRGQPPITKATSISSLIILGSIHELLGEVWPIGYA